VQKTLYGIAAFIVLLVMVGLALPRYSRVEVTVRIDANPATVFALVNDFHRIGLWSSLTDTDPNARIVYSGPVRGVGATLTWDGPIIGTGNEVIVESQPFRHVSTSVTAAGDGESRSWFDVAGGDGETAVSWGLETDCGYNVAARYVALMLKNAIRRDHAEALARLRDLAESLPVADFSDLEIEQITVAATRIAYLPTTSIPEPAAISEAMGDAYFAILNFIDEHGLQEDGAPMSITRSYSGAELMFDAAIPVRGIGDAAPGDGAAVKLGETYAGPVIRVKHIGPYRTLGATHQKILSYLAALGIRRAGDAWESYVSDPTKVPEAELLTYVYYPIEP